MKSLLATWLIFSVFAPSTAAEARGFLTAEQQILFIRPQAERQLRLRNLDLLDGSIDLKTSYRFDRTMFWKSIVNVTGLVFHGLEQSNTIRYATFRAKNSNGVLFDGYLYYWMISLKAVTFDDPAPSATSLYEFNDFPNTTVVRDAATGELTWISIDGFRIDYGSWKNGFGEIDLHLRELPPAAPTSFSP